jgi:hypothetical protein
MNVKLPKRDTLELAFLLSVGVTTAILGVLLMDETPYVDFPFNLNTFFWSLGFITLGLLPAVAYLSPNRNPRVVAISLFIFGGAVAVLAPALGAVGSRVYWNGINPLLLIIVLLITIPATQYAARVKEYLLMFTIALVLVMYGFVGLYLAFAFQETQNAVVFVPFLGGAFVVLAVVATFLNEYRRTGLRRLDL